MAAIDTLKDKWDAITPRERMLVVLLGISAVATALILLAFSIIERLDAMDARNRKARRALEVLSDYRVKGRTTDARVAGPTIGAQSIKLESYVDKAAQKVEITVPSYKPRSAPKNGFNVHTVELDVKGLEIEKIKDFLEAIESGNEPVAVTSLKLKRNFSDKTKLDLNIEVSTYSTIAAAPGTGSGSGTGTGTAAPAGGTK